MNRIYKWLLKNVDKVAHFAIIYGIVFTLATHWTLDGAIAVGLLLAVGKEVYDYFAYGRHTKGFWKMTLGDLIADAVGIIVAVFLGA